MNRRIRNRTYGGVDAGYGRPAQLSDRSQLYTDKYIDIELTERTKSAGNKKLIIQIE